jgi:hypothetical protein
MDKYIYYKIEQHDSTKKSGKIRPINIYTIRLNSMTPLKQSGKIRRSNIYTKGGDQTDTYIYKRGRS